MSDLADQAQEYMDVELKVARINHNLSAREAQLPRTGFCHNCQAPISMDKPFCNADCRDDWDARQFALAQKPRR